MGHARSSVTDETGGAVAGRPALCIEARHDVQRALAGDTFEAVEAVRRTAEA